MKKFKILFALIFCLLATNSWAKEDYKEYGIALILPKEYFSEAQKMNREIAAQVPKISNLPNVFHITLFQGRFTESEIAELYQELENQNFSRIKIKLEKIKTAKELYINWQVKKSEELKNLHKVVVNIANPYHHDALLRYVDTYNELGKKERQQVDEYGMAGLFDEYQPHVTLFYFPKKNSEIGNIAKKISLPKFAKNSGMEVDSLVIAELGYNGNIEKILYEIKLK